MAIHLKTWLIGLMTITPLFAAFANNLQGTRVAAGSIDSMLTIHKWKLVEIIEKKDTSVKDITLMMVSCEKDNYLQFSSGGTYQIFEGPTKCNESDNNVKGQGVWQFNAADTSLVERYEGGKRVNKKIITLSDEVLIVQYYGEGDRLLRLTYLSEIGQQNKAEILALSEGDPSQFILQFIKGYLLSTNRYVVLDKKEFDKGGSVQDRDKDGALPAVVLLPFVQEGTGQHTVNLQQNALLGKAVQMGVDYVVTGRILESAIVKNNKKEEDKLFLGSVKFEILLLDLSDSCEQSELFNGGQPATAAPPKKKKGQFWGNMARKFMNIFPGLLTGWGIARGSYQTVYAGSILASNTQKASEAVTMFGNVNNDIRKRNYDSSTAIINAAAESEADIREFVADHVVPKIKIHRLEGTGKKIKLTIEAGSNIYLKEDEVLKVVRITHPLVKGKVTQEKEELGTIKVTQIAGRLLAYCSIEEGSKEIAEAYSKTPDEVLVVTALQAAGGNKK